MPCYHSVFHAFGTWTTEHRRGWHQHGVRGEQQPSQKIANHRHRNQKFPAVRFDENTQRAILQMGLEACARRRWRAHVAATNDTHLHLVASWTGVVDPVWAHGRIKNMLGLRAAEANGTRGRPWFSHGGKPKRVRDAAHLRELVKDYLVGLGGLFWKEGDVAIEWP